MLLPEEAALVRTGEDDPLPYYFRLHTRWFYRLRLRMLLSCLPREGEPYGDLLEIGFGSGILLEEESRRARRVAGIDLHARVEEVRAGLAARGVSADLRSGSVLDIPFPDASQDAAVCLSVLEHLEDVDRAAREIARVLRPGGVLAAAFPVKSRLSDALLAALGYRADHIHPSDDRRILEALGRLLDVERTRRLPGLFVAVRCRKRGA